MAKLDSDLQNFEMVEEDTRKKLKKVEKYLRKDSDWGEGAVNSDENHYHVHQTPLVFRRARAQK